jgi:DNA-binding CsgD family transcriptional regulator/PAS domain-containing protein
LNAPRPDLIADIYAAALDEQTWPQFSTFVGKAAGIEAVSVWLTDHGRITDSSMAPIYAPFMAPYREHFGTLDPWAAGLARNRPEAVMLACEHIREAELEKSEFYNDFARRGGMYRPIGVRLRLAPHVYATMGSENPFAKKLFDEADKRRVERLLPYVKRALQLRLRQRQSIPATAPYSAALNAFAFGVIICDVEARPVFANAAAEDLARRKTGFVLPARGDAVSALVARETSALAGFVRDAATGGAGGALQLTARDGAPGLLALITPLPTQLSGHYGTGFALISLQSVSDRPSFAETTLGNLFHLSPAQASIALALHSGQTAEEIAAQRGVRMSTLRTHLSEIFLRTRTENQRELIRLLGILPPVR